MVDIILLILVALCFVCILGLFYLIIRLSDRVQKLDIVAKEPQPPLQLDESSITRVQELTEAYNKARKDLGQQVGVARVAIRETAQAVNNIRQAQRGVNK